MTTEPTTPHWPLRARDHRRQVTSGYGDIVNVFVLADGSVRLAIYPDHGIAAGATLSADEVTRVVQALIVTSAESALDRAVADALSAIAGRFNPPDPDDEPIEPDDPYWEPY